MANPLNELGIIKRFNGIDIQQSSYFIKLSCPTYIDKIVQHHGWQNEKAATLAVPMKNDMAFQADLELSNGPDDPKEQRKLEHEMQFSYRQAIGELIFAMTLLILPTTRQVPLPGCQGCICFPTRNTRRRDILLASTSERYTSGRSFSDHFQQRGRISCLHRHRRPIANSRRQRLYLGQRPPLSPIHRRRGVHPSWGCNLLQNSHSTYNSTIVY